MADLNQTRRMAARGAQGLGMTALAAAIGLAFAAGAQAQQQDADSTPLRTPLRTPLLAPVQVQGDAPDYQADRLSSGKFTQPLVDTPQSVTVVPRQLIEEQRAQSLQEVLRNVPGITFTSGEGNLGWGDMFTIRGFSAEQSIMVDGIRDAGLASRSDTFNLERVEVFKGTGGLESGVSAVGGAVN
ncbi:MAG: TonB-dependent receptor plug domain-containing protein, partial [Bordetella sp.]|nr:TonB-dependent receptor plug domain-containing protein [Bordetella sp.]